MKPRLLLLITLVLALLGAGAYWLYQNLERYTRLENTGPTLDTLINRWHAAQAFLEQHNISSHRAMDLHDVLHRLQAQDALVLFNDTALYDLNHQQQLKEWMNQGGHLVITANYEWDEEAATSSDPFLDSMGVRLLWLEEDDEAASAEQNDEQFEEQDSSTDDNDPTPGQEENASPLEDFADIMDPVMPPAEDSITPACGIYGEHDIYRVAYADDADLLQINFGYSYTLEDASGNAIRTAGADPNGLLQYAVGKGRMTVLLETDIWTNRAIGDFDHAFLLWHLIGDRPLVWLVASHESENLLKILWRNARYLLIGLLAWLLLWGWRRWVRFGPLVPDPSPERRQLLEHIEASTRFQWKHQQLEPLLQRLRDDIWLHLNRHHGIDHQQGDNSIAALRKLAELSQQPADIIRQAMTCPAPQREINWIELISQLQTIRNAL